MISRIEAVNYRCLRNISQDLGRFHVVAGPNGSGKSTFLEVVRVLAAFATEGLDSVWDESKARQIPELLFGGKAEPLAPGMLSNKPPPKFQLAVEMPIPDTVLDQLDRKNSERKKFVRYELELGCRTLSEVNEARIFAENLWLLDAASESKRSETVQAEFDFPARSKTERDLIHGQSKTPAGWRKVASKSSELNAYFKSETSDWNFTLKNGRRRSALSSLPEDERFGLANWAKASLTQAVRKLSLRSELMQRPCPPLKEKRFEPDGSTLPLVVQQLQRDGNAFKSWLEHLHTVLPIRDVVVIEREEDKSTYLRVSYESGLQVPSWHVSDGTLRMMALTLLPYLRSEGTIFLVEEPENGVHPQAIEAIFQSLSSVYDGQVLVATHSPILVGLIKPEQLLCFSKTPEGETDIVRGDRHPKLRQWQGEFRLAQLFAAGVLELKKMPYPKDLIVVVPDGAIGLVVQTLLEERRPSLKIRGVKFETLKDPLHDASPESTVVTLLRGYLRTHERALVIRDIAGSGWEQRGAARLREALLTTLTNNGWHLDRLQAIILEPEIEAWLRLDSAHVWELVRDRARRNLSPIALQFAHHVRQTVAAFGGELRGKPVHPKECFEGVLEYYGIPRSNALYRELARYESLEGCVVPSFQEFVNTLRAWFPKAP